MNKLLDWLDHRSGYRAFMKDALYERVPGGARWRYVWGSTLVFAFVVQTITGLFLWTAYSPNAQGAWESVYYIQHEMQAGWLLRGLHHFMAQAMVVLLAIHLMQVIIDGAYKAPREVNFWIGLILMQVVLGLSLTGYLLPWDQKGYWATKVATNIMGATPIIGPQLQKIVVGGTEYGHHTLTRFFALHAGILPGLLILFLMAHIYVFRRHGLKAYKPDPSRDTTFWPDQVLKDSVACLAVLAVVLFLVFLPGWQGHATGTNLGADLGAPADPSENYSSARPEWYFLFLFQLLKYFKGETEVIGSHIIPAMVMGFLFLMPFLGQWKLGHRFNVGFTFCLMIGVVLLTWDAIDEDGKDPLHIAAVEDAHRVAQRMPLLVEEYGISTEGAVALVRNDPLLAGPKLFAKKCAQCHRYNGHDGTGHVDPSFVATATDLGDFGTRAWMRAVLTDYANQFAPLKNARWEGENVGDNFVGEDAEMLGWSEGNKDVLLQKENEQSLAALVEFLVAQGERTDVPRVDHELVKTGRQIFEEGTLAAGDMQTCVDCHSIHPAGEEELLEGGSDNAPHLTGYGGAEWLHSFIANPGADAHYRNTNAMPAFEESMSQHDRDLLVRWMVGEYVKSPETAASVGE